MNDLIIPGLVAVIAALLLLGGPGAFVPRLAAGIATTIVCGVGTVCCLPPLLWHAAPSALALPFGPPDLSLGLALDPISTFFLLVVLFAGTAVAAFEAAAEASAPPAPNPAIPLCVAGLMIGVLAADAVTLAIGFSLASLALRSLNTRPVTPFASAPPTIESRAAEAAPLAAPLLLLIAVVLLAPAGFAPCFETIRAAPVDGGRATAAAILVGAAGFGLLCQPSTCHPRARQALAAGAMVPSVIYILLRLIIDLPGTATPSWWGFALLLAGGAAAIADGWRASRHVDLAHSVALLARRQIGLAVVALGLSLTARSADLPESASFGLAAALLLTVGSGVAGTLASLCANALGTGAGTLRLARLGGLIHPMPVASVALLVALLALSAIPAGAGFASIWLLFEAVLAAPRSGGVIAQLPLALIAVAVALSAALATATALRLIGIALLGPPRGALGSAALDVGPGRRAVLLALGGLSIVIGIVPGLASQSLGEPVVRALTEAGEPAGAHWAALPASAASPGYAPLALAALLTAAIGSIVLIMRWLRPETRTVAMWTDGTPIAVSLPFDDPTVESTGPGFLATLPGPRLRLPIGPSLRLLNRPSAAAGLWAILLGFGALLLVLEFVAPGGMRQ